MGKRLRHFLSTSITNSFGFIVRYYKIHGSNIRKYSMGFIVGSWVTMLVYNGVPSQSFFDTHSKSDVKSVEDSPLENDGTNDWIQDSSAYITNENGQYIIPDTVILDEFGVVVVNSANQALVDKANTHIEKQSGQAYIEISSNNDPAYWIMDPDLNKAMWYYTITFKETNGVGLNVEEIVETYVNVAVESSGIHHSSSELKTWWGDSYIPANGQRNVNGGCNSQLVSYIIWTVRGTDDNNHKVEYSYVLPLSQFSKDKDIHTVQLDPEFDTLNLRNNADFEVNISDGVFWVPANSLGSSSYSNQQIEAMLTDSPEQKQAKIHTLYEAIQLYQISNFIAQDGSNIHQTIDSIQWEYHIPGKLAVEINAGDCSTSSAWLAYLLKDDYDEVGYIAYSNLDGQGHIFNYIKQDGEYYFIDMTHYRSDFIDSSGIETGEFGDYRSSDYIAGNIHKVENIEDYIDYSLASYNDPPELFFMYVSDNPSDIGVSTVNGRTTIYYPTETKVNNVYDNPSDSLSYMEVSKTNYIPNWSSTTKNPITSILPFN